MTIRYSCEQCGSVLKIKDDRAGKDAHCPKCKATFVVPMPDESAPSATLAATVESEESAAPALARAPGKGGGVAVEPIRPAGASARPVAAAGASEDADFDPVAFLMAEGQNQAEKSASKPAAKTPPGSEADMRIGRAKGPSDYTASEEPDVRVGGGRRPAPTAEEEEDAEQRLQRKLKRPTPPSAAQTADEMLRSTAAANAKELMTKTMEESRLRAAQMPATPQKPGIDYKEAGKDLFLRFAPAVGGFVLLFVLAYYVGQVMVGSGPDLPDLGYVSGKVTKAGKPMVDAMVQFIPVDNDKASVATSYTDAEGNYTLKYTEGIEGAVLGKNRVEVSLLERGREQVPPQTPYGMGSNMIETVKEGSQTIDIKIP